MALTKLLADVQNHAAQIDEPNDVGGLTPAQYKAVCDKAPVDIKTYINDVLTVESDTKDGANVKLTGNQSVAGVKTFASSPIIPTPTTDYQSSTKKYVDDTNTSQTGALTTHKSSADHDGRYYTETELNAGQLDTRYYTETELNANFSSKSETVKMTGNETVAGIKTFSSSPFVPTPTTDMQASTKKYADDLAAAFALGAIPDTTLTNAKLAADIKIGSLATLSTTEKGSVVGAVNEVNAFAGGAIPKSIIDAENDFIIGTADNTPAKKTLAETTAILGIDAHIAENSLGWKLANETWTYASATTFTITGDKTAKYNIGDKIKLTSNSVVLYAYVVGVVYSSPNTAITVRGNTLTDFAYTLNYFSKYASPQTFPQWFVWTPTLTWAGAGTPATNVVVYARYCVIGRTCYFAFQFLADDGNGATGLQITLPATSKNNGTVFNPISSMQIVNGATITNPIGYVREDTSYVSFYALGTCTDNQNVYVMASGFYEI